MKPRWIMLIVLGCLLVSLTACSAEDINFVQSMLDEWAKAKNVNPTNQDGSINFGGLINAGASALDLPGGDDEVKAAIDAKGVVDSIKAADEAAKKAQQALYEGNPALAVKLLDPSVKDRPKDWWLLNQRGVANLEAGNSQLGSNDLQDAIDNGKPGQAAEDQLHLLNASINRQQGQLVRCETYTALASAYSNLLKYGKGEPGQYRKLMDTNNENARQPGVTCR